MERKIEKKDNFISIEAAEGDKVQIQVADSKPLVFIIPYDGKINLYIKRELIPLRFED